MAISYLHYKGKKIMFCDYSQCKTAEETIHVLNLAREEYLKSDEHFLVLNDFTGGVMSNEFMNLARKYGTELFDKRTPKTASIGITGMKKVLLSTYNVMVKNKLMMFDKKIEAMEFLVQ
jgi:hypothetical protein